MRIRNLVNIKKRLRFIRKLCESLEVRNRNRLLKTMKKKTNWFKIGFEKNWHFMVSKSHISIIFLFLSSCTSIHQKSVAVKPWSGSESPSNQRTACRAKVSLALKTKNHRLSALSYFSYQHSKENSALHITLLNPFGLTYAKIAVSPEINTWTDKEGRFDLSDHPIFAKWFSEDWWQEIGFMFGHIEQEQIPHIWANKAGEPVEFRRASRTINCQRTSMDPQVCHISDDGLKARLNFSSVDCKEPLK